MKNLSQLIELPIKVDVSKLTHEEREELQMKLFEHDVVWNITLSTKPNTCSQFIFIAANRKMTHIANNRRSYFRNHRNTEIKIEELQEILGMKPKQFTKADLKDGMVIRIRTESYGPYMVLGSRLITTKSHLELVEYNDDLTDTDHNMWDVMEVLELAAPANSLEIETWELKSVWKREEKSAAQLEIEAIQKQMDELNARLETLKWSV